MVIRCTYIYGIEFILSTLYQKEAAKIKSSVSIMVIRCTWYVFESNALFTFESLYELF